MNAAELEELAKDQEALGQADNILSILPDPIPDPLTESDMEPILSLLKNMRGAYKDPALQTAVDAANLAWLNALSVAIDDSKVARQNDINTLVGTDTTA